MQRHSLFDQGPPIDRFAGEYAFLSNFFVASTYLDARLYPTAEHAFVAAKTTDEDIRKQVALIPTPGQAKRFGRTIKLRTEWNTIRVVVMLTIIRSKFSFPCMADKLLETGRRQLIEGNTWNDTFWGVCNGKGKNMLGHVLMQVRSEII